MFTSAHNNTTGITHTHTHALAHTHAHTHKCEYTNTDLKLYKYKIIYHLIVYSIYEFLYKIFMSCGKRKQY